MAEQLPLQFEFRANQTFDDYFPGNNQVIFDQLRRFATDKSGQYIYLWGSTGYGKSHLLQACCHAAAQIGLSSLCLDFKDFIEKDPALLVGFEVIDMVCLDNIDALVGHEDWELALFNFFNRHHESGKKLLLSATCPPNALPLKLPDLQTRINWGLCLNLKPFGDNDKIAALVYKAQQKGFDISPQVARFLLNHYDRKLASLWQMLDKLDSASLAAKRKLTIPFLKAVMGQRDL